MGIRFTTNTWRAPLLLIDSWLPLAHHTRTQSVRSLLPQVVQRFARAGWLGRASNALPLAGGSPVTVQRLPVANSRNGICKVRVLQTAETPNGIRPDARLVISGRINDVCAELERLAALEHQHGKAAA